MADRWIVTIEAWPHSSGNGAEADQKAAGPRTSKFPVVADGFKAAFEAAVHIATGMRANPMVWQAPIVGIVREGESLT